MLTFLAVFRPSRVQRKLPNILSKATMTLGLLQASTPARTWWTTTRMRSSSLWCRWRIHFSVFVFSWIFLVRTMRILTASRFVTRPRVSRVGSQSPESSHYSSHFVTFKNDPDPNKTDFMNLFKNTVLYSLLGWHKIFFFCFALIVVLFLFWNNK